MNAFIAVAFMLALGSLFKVQGWTAILWMPLGLAVSLFAVSNILLLPLMGFPMARNLKRMGIARPGLERAIFTLVAALSLFVIAVIGVATWIWPTWVRMGLHNPSLLVGAGIGAIGVLMSPLSAKAKADFALDFFKRFSKYIILPEIPGKTDPVKAA